MLHSLCFHMLAEPVEVIHQVQDLLQLRKAASNDAKPLIIWEPRPSSCIPANLDAFREAARVVDIFSPNHVELTAMFVDGPSEVALSMVAEHALSFVRSGIGQSGQGCVVIRAGEDGCFVASQTCEPTWLSPYYERNEATGHACVIDPTGAGNAFLGAFAVGLIKTDNIYDAACYGAVGSSFAIEQVGLPELSTSGGDRELWNEECVMERLRVYQTRLTASVP